MAQDLRLDSCLCIDFGGLRRECHYHYCNTGIKSHGYFRTVTNTALAYRPLFHGNARGADTGIYRYRHGNTNDDAHYCYIASTNSHGWTHSDGRIGADSDTDHTRYCYTRADRDTDASSNGNTATYPYTLTHTPRPWQ